MTEVCVVCWEDCDEPKLNCLCRGEGNGIVHLECLKKMSITKCPQCQVFLKDEFDRRLHEFFAIILLFLFQNKKTTYNYDNAIDKLLRNETIKQKIWEFNEMILLNAYENGFFHAEGLGDFRLSCMFLYDLKASRHVRCADRTTNDIVYLKSGCDGKLASFNITIMNPSKTSRAINCIKRIKQIILGAFYL